MKKSFIIAVLFSMTVAVANAQEALKKVYNENINPMEQIDNALVKARRTASMWFVRWAATGVRGVCASLTSWRRTRR